MAAGAYPIVKSLKPSEFLRALSIGEIAVGTALLAPLVSTADATDRLSR